MTQKKGTKRALLLSVLALVMCCSMLIGSTYAWFTDSVTSTGNKIQSGTLTLDLELLDKATGTWNSIKEDKTALFNYSNWEPGYTEVKVLKVENEGSLALKWVAKIVTSQELSILSDVIDVYVLPYGVLSDADALTTVKYPTRALENYKKVGTLKNFVNTIEETTFGTLLEDESAYLGIALKMQESAGNDYQGKDLGGLFDIQIFATQLNSEEDSFDKDYDIFADYDGEISTEASLIAALNNGGTYKVMNDINVDKTMTVPAGVEVTLDLDGKTIAGTGVRDADGNRIHTILNNGTLTLVGGTIASNGTNGGSAVYNKGTLTLENVTVNGALSENATGYASYAVNTDGAGSEVTINNATISGRGVIGATNGATVTINGGLFEAIHEGESAHVVYIAQDGKVIINGGTFNHTRQNASANGDVLIYVTKTDNSSAVINGGTFNAVKAAVSYNGMNLEIKGGTFKNTSATVYQGSLDSLLADGYTAVENADGTYTVIKGVKVNNKAELSALLNSAETEVTAVLADGNYDNVLTSSNKKIHLIGSKDAVISITNALSSSHDHMGLTNCDVTLENVTVTFEDGAYYAAYINNPTMTYIGCTIIGQQYIYGNTTFIKCVFDNDDDAAKSAMRYTYVYDGDVVVDDCDFYTQGHALIMYSDNGGSGDQTLTVKNSRFHGGAGRTAWAVAGQNTAAIEIDGACGANYTLNLEGTNTFDGGFSGLWRIKDMKAGVTTTVNGVEYTGTASDVYLDGAHYIKAADRTVTLAN